MDLLIVRHAIAEDREVFAQTEQDDGLRPLTPKGRRRMRRAVRGLRSVVRRIDLLASSPLVRAKQTADIVAAGYRGVERVELGELTPDAAPDAFRVWLAEQGGRDLVAAVGHEPSLSTIVTWLLAERSDPVIELKKGAMCLVRFTGPIRPGFGMLVWALTPAQLRGLA